MFARRCVCARNRSHPFATVRNRLREATMWPHLWQVLQPGSLLEVSFVAEPRFAWQASHLVKIVFAWRTHCVWDTFRTWVVVYMAGAALWIHHLVLHGRRSTSDISCCVFPANPFVGAARSGDKVQLRGERGMLWDDVTWIDGHLAQTWILRLQIQRGSKPICRKTLIFNLESARIWGSFARNASFDAPTCLVLNICGFHFVYGASCKNYLVSRCQSNLQRGFALMVRCFMSLSWVCKQHLCRNSSCLAGARLLRPTHSTRDTPPISHYTTLPTLRFKLCTPHFTLHTPHFTFYAWRFTLHTLHSTFHTPQTTLPTLHFAK